MVFLLVKNTRSEKFENDSEYTKKSRLASFLFVSQGSVEIEDAERRKKEVM